MHVYMGKKSLYNPPMVGSKPICFASLAFDLTKPSLSARRLRQALVKFGRRQINDDGGKNDAPLPFQSFK